MPVLYLYLILYNLPVFYMVWHKTDDTHNGKINLRALKGSLTSHTESQGYRLIDTVRYDHDWLCANGFRCC